MLSHDVKDIQQLRQIISDTLCHHEQLETGIFPMTERVLQRAGRPCGIFFCLYGPRQVRSTAIWETDTNTILFYGSNGERIQKMALARGILAHAPNAEF